MDRHRSLWPVVFLVGLAGCAGTRSGGVAQAPSGERAASKWLAWRGRAGSSPTDKGGNEGDDPGRAAPARTTARAPAAPGTDDAPPARTNHVSERVARFFPMLNRHEGGAAPSTARLAPPAGRDLWADSARVGAQARLERWRENARNGTPGGEREDGKAGEAGDEASILPVSLEVRPGRDTSVRPREGKSSGRVRIEPVTDQGPSTLSEPGVVPASAPQEESPTASRVTLPEAVEAEPRATAERTPTESDVPGDADAPPPSPADTPPPPEAPAGSLKPGAAPDDLTPGPAPAPRTAPAPSNAPPPRDNPVPGPRSRAVSEPPPPAEAPAPVKPSPAVGRTAPTPVTPTPTPPAPEPNPSSSLFGDYTWSPSVRSSQQESPRAMTPAAVPAAVKTGAAPKKCRLKQVLAALTHHSRKSAPHAAAKTLPMPALPSKQMPGPIYAQTAPPVAGSGSAAPPPATDLAGRPRLASASRVVPSASRIGTTHGTAPLFPAAYYVNPGPTPYYANLNPTKDGRAPRANPVAPGTAPTKPPRTSILGRVLARVRGAEEVERHPAGCDCGKHPRGATPESVAAEPGHVAERGERVERVAAHRLDEPAER